MSTNILDEIDTLKPLAYSNLQQAIFEAVREASNDLLIQAVAGSGKTTTIIEAMRYAEGSSLFMAFNKAIAEDIRRKATAGDVKTLNALGHSLVLGNRPTAELNSRKMLDLVKKVMGDTSEFKEFGYSLSRVCGLAKNCALGISEAVEPSDFTDLIDAYAFDIPFDFVNTASFICREAFELSRLDLKTFDFDDQLWMPISEGWTFPKYANIFIDEAQDLSPIQHLMLDKLKSRGSRLVAVGDRFQAIYGFRGASHDSMDLLKGRFAMKELPLSISYRCAQSVVRSAQAFCPDIQWREGAPEGEVLTNDFDPHTPDQFARYMIVCRNNAPLFKEILAHVRAKQPCQVLSSFLDSFQGFIRGFKTRYTSDLSAKLDHWFERERDAAERSGKRGKLRGLKDKYDTIQLLCRDYKLTEDMISMVKGLSLSKRGPIFATIHKSKGLEHEHIYILRPDLLGGFGDLNEAQKQQEDNLHYVAITRAKETLTYGAKLR